MINFLQPPPDPTTPDGLMLSALIAQLDNSSAMEARLAELRRTIKLAQGALQSATTAIANAEVRIKEIGQRETAVGDRELAVTAKEADLEKRETDLQFRERAVEDLHRHAKANADAAEKSKAEAQRIVDRVKEAAT